MEQGGGGNERGLVSGLRTRGLRALQITIEPTLFFFHLAIHIQTASANQITILKTCLIDFNHNETVCQHLKEYDDINSGK